MGEKQVKVWYDPEGDYLAVIFEQKDGYFRETDDGRLYRGQGFIALLGTSQAKYDKIHVDI